jgi:hypothetical protein
MPSCCEVRPSIFDSDNCILIKVCLPQIFRYFRVREVNQRHWEVFGHFWNLSQMSQNPDGRVLARTSSVPVFFLVFSF